MLSLEMKEFSERYSLGEEGEIELIKLFNKSLIEISGKILENYDVNEKKVKSKIEIKRKFASKKAEEYAYENGISIEEFEIEKISKKDVEEKIRKRIKEGNNVEKDVEEVCKKRIERKVLCCGLTKKGEQCTRAGTLKPNGAKKMYCFRHADEWNAFECESDSSDEELDLKKINNLSDE